jgi:hypothetical protein
MQRSCSTFLSPQFSSDLFILKSLFLQFFQHYSLKILVSIFVYLLCSIHLIFFLQLLTLKDTRSYRQFVEKMFSILFAGTIFLLTHSFRRNYIFYLPSYNYQMSILSINFEGLLYSPGFLYLLRQKDILKCFHL